MERQRSKAYTLIELALVLLIISLIYSTIAPAILHMVDEAKVDNVEAELKKVGNEIDDFFKKNGRFPDSLDEIYSPVPLDPWGNPYVYLNIADSPTKGKGKLRKDKNLVPINSDYDLYSAGPDGQSASALTAQISQDDIVRGRDGLYIGPAADY